tara:strand:- start:347 stop:697 length:351 start_codon:yes stop_codon:yes gene_type:complete
MTKKQPYYPNNWKQYKDSPDKFFFQIPFDEFMDWKIAGWEMPSSVACMIRETNTRTGKVKEYIYQSQRAAENRARKIMDRGESEFVVCTHDSVHHMTPKLLEDYAENYDPFEDPLS